MKHFKKILSFALNHLIDILYWFLWLMAYGALLKALLHDEINDNKGIFDMNVLMSVLSIVPIILVVVFLHIGYVALLKWLQRMVKISMDAYKTLIYVGYFCNFIISAFLWFAIGAACAHR